MNGKERSATSQIIRGLIAIAIGIIIWYLPAPAGVKKEAMHLLAMRSNGEISRRSPFPSAIGQSHFVRFLAT